MSNSELILEFIDGTLDSAVEQGLFQEMAQRPELRSELRQFINIADAVHSDREAFAPPAHLEHALMAGVGLLPATGPDNAAAAVVLTNGGNRFWLMTSSFIVGALLAASTVWLMLRGDGAIGNQPSIASPTSVSTSSTTNRSVILDQSGGSTTGGRGGTDGTTTSLAQDKNQQAVAAVQKQTTLAASNAAETNPPVRERIRYVYINSARSTATDQSAITENSNGSGKSVDGGTSTNPLAASTQLNLRAESLQATDTAARVSETTLLMPPQSALGTHHADTAPQLLAKRGSTFLQTSSPLSSNSKQDEGIVILSEARYQFARNAIPTQALSGAYSLPENFAAGAYVQLSDAWYLGAEIGVERYAQTLLINRNDTFAIDQQPRYTWGGVAARYDFGAIPSLPARLYFQVTGGATSAGPLVRFRIGAPLQLADGIALSPGFEFSSLVYMFNNQRLFSGRWGATVGTEFNVSKLLW